MTSVLNSPTDFARQHLRGFALLHAELLRPVHGGVVREDRPPVPSAAVVTGGGTGHFPAFCGWVGPGLADGAAVGDVFASPSADQIVSVCRAADNGGGVLLAYGNYAGHELNFTEAQGRLEAAGVRVRNLPITDDVTSAPAARRDQRRGTAGDLVVIKVAGAAAAAGYDLERVASLAARANARTFSFGIAFAGCTLPGSDHPLFSLPPGHMGVGMGVHGEPGVGEQSVAPATELAALLVERLLEERPADADGRVVALLNGLGSTGFEELFLLWGEVHDRLVAAGLTIVAPEVDELVTSLDMEGISLTLCWLDDELQALWTSPCRSAAFTRTATSRSAAVGCSRTRVRSPARRRSREGQAIRLGRRLSPPPWRSGSRTASSTLRRFWASWTRSPATATTASGWCGVWRQRRSHRRPRLTRARALPTPSRPQGMPGVPRAGGRPGHCGAPRSGPQG